MEIPNGSQYQGQFKNDLPDGDGQLSKAEEESSYSGQFQGGIRSGTGRAFYHKTGNRFVGKWVDDMRREGYTISTNGVVNKEYFLGATVMRRELLSVEEQRRVVEDANKSVDADPPLPPVDPKTFITAAEEDIPRYEVQVTRFAKSRGEMAALTKEEDEFNF